MKWQKVFSNKQRQREEDQKRDLNPDFFDQSQIEEVDTQNSLISGTLIPKQSHNPLCYKSPTKINKYWHNDEEQDQLHQSLAKEKLTEEYCEELQRDNRMKNNSYFFQSKTKTKNSEKMA